MLLGSVKAIQLCHTVADGTVAGARKREVIAQPVTLRGQPHSYYNSFTPQELTTSMRTTLVSLKGNDPSNLITSHEALSVLSMATPRTRLQAHERSRDAGKPHPNHSQWEH